MAAAYNRSEPPSLCLANGIAIIDIHFAVGLDVINTPWINVSPVSLTKKLCSGPLIRHAIKTCMSEFTEAKNIKHKICFRAILTRMAVHIPLRSNVQ